ncbi:hypothetical protein SERLA73DRAFT_156173 [Serpula lacrymans var. lacrymans S7.3]|uniref:Uncharacterized protein n=2 Tax=Serpula lacrymans var. lacrymans TaxID=341189 RepID=F8QDB4_SERL3|nr:uncharacterized protein SERLADRAFT_443504 [Serpula lacrymans var. lacrymans S7.9]EGN93585.1 hypothetical protein SERLA73DRAFT_156173 [Serpula lacrymans var. lacrymans S7.3]EGO18957.1 hypothetical protein SERLADRAFT_443504 [Serpula lacrymans var. lacrymans S7.9]
MAASTSGSSGKTPLTKDDALVIWDAVSPHLTHAFNTADGQSLEYLYYGLVDFVFQHCALQENQRLYEAQKQFQLILHSQYHLAIDLSNPDVASPSEQSSGSQTALKQDNSGCPKLEDENDDGDDEDEDGEEEDITNFTLIASSGHDGTDILICVIEVKPHGRTAGSKRLHFVKCQQQLLRQAQAAFDTYPSQDSVNVFCVLGRFWKLVYFKREIFNAMTCFR